MSKLLTALVLSLVATAAYAMCTTSTYNINGKVTVCTTCCYPGAGCNTTCF